MLHLASHPATHAGHQVRCRPCGEVRMLHLASHSRSSSTTGPGPQHDPQLRSPPGPGRVRVARSGHERTAGDPAEVRPTARPRPRAADRGRRGRPGAARPPTRSRSEPAGLRGLTRAEPGDAGTPRGRGRPDEPGHRGLGTRGHRFRAAGDLRRATPEDARRGRDRALGVSAGARLARGRRDTARGVAPDRPRGSGPGGSRRFPAHRVVVPVTDPPRWWWLHEFFSGPTEKPQWYAPEPRYDPFKRLGAVGRRPDPGSSLRSRSACSQGARCGRCT